MCIREKRLKKIISFKDFDLGREWVRFIFQHIFSFLYAELYEAKENG
jgi:hypothetical protein